MNLDADSTFSCSFETMSMTVGFSFKDIENFEPIAKLKAGEVKLKLENFSPSAIVNKMVNSLLDKMSSTISKFIEESVGSTLKTVLKKIVDEHKDTA